MALVACYEAEESGPAVQPSLLIVEMAQHTEAGRPTDLEKQWAPLRRESPDPTAPSTPPFPVRLGISPFTYPALLLTLLVVLPYTVIKHITVGPPADWMPLSTHLEGRLVYWSGKLVDSAYLPPQDKEEAAVPSNLPLEWAKEGRRGVDVEKVIVPKLETKYRMGLGEIRGVESEDRPGFILTPRELKAVGSGTELAEEGEKVIMYLFGGGYASGHPVKFPFPWQMSKVLGTRLFGVNYRKTLSSETAFPAPILDALAGYLYLTQKLRFPSSSIILLGDSSGAHLGLCLSQHLHDLRIAQPGYILLTSPLGDVRRAMPSRAEFAGVDILAETMDAKPLHSAMRHYTDGAKDQPAFSPARSRKGDWTFLREEQVKVYIMVGTKEILRDDGLAIVEAMKRDGVDVTLREDVGGSHCGPLAQWKGSSAWQVWQDDTKRIVQGRRYIVEDADEA